MDRNETRQMTINMSDRKRNSNPRGKTSSKKTTSKKWRADVDHDAAKCKFEHEELDAWAQDYDRSKLEGLRFLIPSEFRSKGNERDLLSVLRGAEKFLVEINGNKNENSRMKVKNLPQETDEQILVLRIAVKVHDKHFDKLQPLSTNKVLNALQKVFSQHVAVRTPHTGTTSLKSIPATSTEKKNAKFFDKKVAVGEHDTIRFNKSEGGVASQGQRAAPRNHLRSILGKRPRDNTDSEPPKAKKKSAASYHLLPSALTKNLAEGRASTTTRAGDKDEVARASPHITSDKNHSSLTEAAGIARPKRKVPGQKEVISHDSGSTIGSQAVVARSNPALLNPKVLLGLIQPRVLEIRIRYEYLCKRNLAKLEHLELLKKYVKFYMVYKQHFRKVIGLTEEGVVEDAKTPECRKMLNDNSSNDDSVLNPCLELVIPRLHEMLKQASGLNDDKIMATIIINIGYPREWTELEVLRDALGIDSLW